MHSCNAQVKKLEDALKAAQAKAADKRRRASQEAADQHKQQLKEREVKAHARFPALAWACPRRGTCSVLLQRR